MHLDLPRNDTVAQVLGKQVLRAGTLVGANYREASQGRSKAEFTSNLLDETHRHLHDNRQTVEGVALFDAVSLFRWSLVLRLVRFRDYRVEGRLRLVLAVK